MQHPHQRPVAHLLRLAQGQCGECRDRRLSLTKVLYMKKLKNVHPGEVLLEEFLKPLGLSQTRLAQAMGVPPRRVNEIVLGKRAITADTAVRLARALGASEGFWMGLQADYELEEARALLGEDLNRVPRLAA